MKKSTSIGQTMIMNQNLNDQEAFTAALTLAIIAPTEKQANSALELAQKLAHNLSAKDRDLCMKGVEVAFDLQRIFGDG